MAKPHHNLDVWKKSLDFVNQIYKLTAQFPDQEKFGLTSQMRRSAISVPSNIAEGAARSTKKEFINFLYISQGSIAELETQLLIAKNLDFAKDGDLNKLIVKLDEISKMIIGLQKSLRNK
jgi:four helix bundle protein